ncbi:hypothetical protein [Symbiobacterium terraclitae]|uniref:hypothetical protein n=1 Tax=Symbiobacterium terraclitae TaxID=557451 RepID=UPI0035B55600
MNAKTKWILSGLAALLVSGVLYALPAMAEERGVAPWGNSGPGMMGRMHSLMARHMSGTLMAMHNAMAPLMSQMGAMHDQMMGELSTLLGMTREELDGALAQGKSLDQLAQEKQVAPEEIRSLMDRTMKAFLDKAVENGTLTEEQAEQIYRHHQQNSARCLTLDMGSMHTMMFGSGTW